MKQETRLKRSVDSAVKSTIERFGKLNPTDRTALLEELGEWIFFEYEELELDWLNPLNKEGASNE
tara:strand:- start:2771 stop:2965 length:195 start_codon:yes stop_codon:yes gene_type:complete